MKWFKFYGQDFLTDSKMRILTVEEKMCWIVLMCLAGAEDKEGQLFFVNEEEVMRQAGIEVDTPMWIETKGFIEKFKELDMLQALPSVTSSVTQSNKALRYSLKLTNFSKRQNENLTNAEKQKNYRNRLKITTKPSNNSNQDRSNTRYPRIEENRIEENRERVISPSKEAKDFFSGNFEPILREFIEKTKVSEEILRQEFSKFILYWTERNKSGTKQRWETEKTFEIRRRLNTWLSNIKDFNKNYQPTKTDKF